MRCVFDKVVLWRRLCLQTINLDYTVLVLARNRVRPPYQLCVKAKPSVMWMWSWPRISNGRQSSNWHGVRPGRCAAARIASCHLLHGGGSVTIVPVNRAHPDDTNGDRQVRPICCRFRPCGRGKVRLQDYRYVALARSLRIVRFWLEKRDQRHDLSALVSFPMSVGDPDAEHSARANVEVRSAHHIFNFFNNR